MTNTDLTIPDFLDRNRPVSLNSLPALVDRAAASLAGAKDAAEILEAKELAAATYDLAKRAARLARAKGAHDEIIARTHRAQADALEIEAGAKRRLADEYDAAQERGEVAIGRPKKSSEGEDFPHRSGQQAAAIDDVLLELSNDIITRDEANDRIAKIDPHWAERAAARQATVADIGLTHKDIHEARIIRDAEAADPGIVKRTVEEAVAAGEEPTRAKVRRAVIRTARPETPPARPARGRAAICARVREAVLALSGLPPPHEVVAFLRGTDEAVVIDERLQVAGRWLAEFAELWPNEESEHVEAAE